MRWIWKLMRRRREGQEGGEGGRGRWWRRIKMGNRSRIQNFHFGWVEVKDYGTQDTLFSRFSQYFPCIRGSAYIYLCTTFLTSMQANKETIKPTYDTKGRVAILPLLKEEIQTRFNLISEERVKKIEQNTENLMKIRLKNKRSYDILTVSQFFKKHFLTSRYEYATWVSLAWCHRLTIFHSFYDTQKWQKFHISAMSMLDLP